MVEENNVTKDTVAATQLQKTEAQLRDLQQDNDHLKEKVSQLETEVEHYTQLANRSWDEKLADGFSNFGQRWGDYGPIVILVLIVLTVFTWLVSWSGLFKLCFTLLMLWVFVTSLSVAKSNVQSHFERALYKLRN